MLSNVPIFVVLAVWIAFVFWASFVVNRANPSSLAERLLWYIVIFSMPIVGSRLVLVRYWGQSAAPSSDARMQSELLEARKKQFSKAED